MVFLAIYVKLPACEISFNLISSLSHRREICRGKVAKFRLGDESFSPRNDFPRRKFSRIRYLNMHGTARRLLPPPPPPPHTHTHTHTLKFMIYELKVWLSVILLTGNNMFQKSSYIRNRVALR